MSRKRRNQTENRPETRPEADAIAMIGNEKEFIEAVARDVLAQLSDANKAELVEAEPWMLHFGIGLYIRNTYIHGRELKFYFRDPDTLSGEIIDRMREIVGEENASDHFDPTAG